MEKYIEDQLREKDKRLSPKSKSLIKKKMTEDGFDSYYVYMHDLIHVKNIWPKEIKEYLGINDFVYYGISNRIQDIKNNPKPPAKGKKKLCGRCEKRPRKGAYFCSRCWEEINTISDQIDLDMFGDY